MFRCRYVDAWKRNRPGRKSNLGPGRQEHASKKSHHPGLVNEIVGLVTANGASDMESDDEEEKDDYFSDASED